MNPNNSNSNLAPVGIVPTVSTEILYLSYGFFGLEMLLHPLAIFVSVANVALVLNTAVLHTNLKWILIAQSVSIIITDFTRLVFMVIKMVITRGHILASPATPAIFGFLALYASTFRTLLSYTLLAERALATLMYRKYAHCGTWWCNLGWPVALLALSGVIHFMQDGSPRDVSATTVPSIAILFILQICAILILIRIYTKNKARYQNSNTLTLDQRLQLSENIRTIRQLGPTFILYTISVLLNYGIKLLFVFQWISREEFVKFAFLIQTSLLAVVHILIELTMITQHPLLKRRAILWIYRALAFFRRTSNRISDDQTLGRTGDGAPKNLFGQQLIYSQKQEDHFRMLQDVWNKDS